MRSAGGGGVNVPQSRGWGPDTCMMYAQIITLSCSGAGAVKVVVSVRSADCACWRD